MPPKAPPQPPPPAENPGPFWIQVKYGADETQLFNSDCLACLLADHMKRQCGYDHLAEPVDLLREDKTLVGLFDVNLEGGVNKRRASELVAPKGVYYLCKLVVPEEGEGGAPIPELLYEEPDPGQPETL
mmetsp:Transcript_7106/g.10321  ORF Transcript_7106/g.10321 Transcript_7106/m.10321 type:complete len:129 (+) Transcript_7106:3-389(+)|eukprot:scaffold82184_cov28-Tisochrysis_lutea.AAC.2